MVPTAAFQPPGRVGLRGQHFASCGRAGPQKNALQPWRTRRLCIPPHANAEFVSRMEDVLDVYCRPYDPSRPVVCMDESSKQLVPDVRDPLPMAPGVPQRGDDHYQRNGTCNLFVACEPLRGWREIKVTPRRTRRDEVHPILRTVVAA